MQVPHSAPPGKIRITRTLRDYWIWMRRWFWIVPLTGVAAYFLGNYVAKVTPSVYQSQAVLEVKRMKQEAAGVDEEEKFRLSALGELMSTIEKLKLPDLCGAVAEGATIARLRTEEGIVNFLPERREILPWKRKANEARLQAETPSVVLAGAIPGWLGIRWRENTNLIDLSVDHTNPKIAQAVATGLLLEYERLKDEKVTGSSRNTLGYLMNESRAAKERILEKENSVQLYNRCIELKNNVRTTEDEILVLEKKYKAKWPPLIEARELLNLLRQQFVEELNLVQQSAVEDEKAFWQKNDEQMADLSEEERINNLLRLVESRAIVLAREVATEKELYSSLMAKWNEGNLAEGFTTDEFNVVQPPTLPTWSGMPNRSAIVKDYTIKGIIAGIGIILLLGFLDPTIRTVEDVERITRYEVIGAIPKLKRLTKTRIAGEGTGLYPGIAEGEAMTEETIRTLRAGLSFLGDTDERHTFLITSAMPAEGKSWVSSNLAASFALQGDNTLLVDFDLRRPVQHTIFGLDGKHPGITDYIAQGKELAEIVQVPAQDNLWVVTAGSPTANPAELLTSRNVETFLADAATHFDRIIIDSPPILAVRDALPLAKLSQSVVLVFRTGKTHARALVRALRFLEANGSPAVGIVANYLRGRNPGTYGYYYSYGNKSYEKYYAKNEME